MSGSCLYIDGLSLYYGSVRGTPFLWLDLEMFAQAFGIDPAIMRIHYFATPDPDPTRRERQQEYLRAVRTLPRVKVHEVQGTHAVAEMSQRILEDDRAGKYSLLVVLANDGRFAQCIDALQTRCCVLLANKRKLTDPALPHLGTFRKRISRSSLETSLFPDTLVDADGNEIRKPTNWHEDIS